MPRQAQTVPGRDEFARDTEPFRRELLAHCYRMLGSLTWFSGRDTCMRYVTRFFGAPGDWLMTATAANGQPAAATYLRGADGVHRAFGLAVLTVTAT